MENVGKVEKVNFNLDKNHLVLGHQLDSFSVVGDRFELTFLLDDLFLELVVQFLDIEIGRSEFALPVKRVHL